MMTMIASGHAQTESSEKSWTMDDCIRYAIVHSTNVRRKVMEEKIANTEVQTVLSDFLPSVTGNVNGQYSWGRNIDPETNIYNNYTTFNNYYSLYATLTVFDGGQTINRFRQAKLLRRQGQTQLQQASDDKAIEVMQKFVDVVYAQRCVELASEKYDESTRLLMKTKRMEELGIKSLPDVALVESQVAEDDYNLTHSRNQFQTAMLALKSVMNYPVDDSLMVSYHPSGEVEVPRISDDIYTYALQNNPKAVSAQMNVRKAEFDHIIAKGRLLPSLSLQASVSTGYFRNISGGGSAPPFHSQFWDNVGEGVSASLSLPLFEFSRYKNVRKAKRNIELAQLERDETMRQLHDDITQAVLDCEGYAKEVEKMASKVESDSLAYHLSYRKYEEGMLSTFELRTSSNTLLDSRIRLLQMQMMYIIKRKLVNYYKGEGI